MKLSEEMRERAGDGKEPIDVALRLWASQVAKLEASDYKDQLDEAEVKLVNAYADLANTKRALVEAVIPLEVIAGQHRIKPYLEISSELFEQIDRSIQIVRDGIRG